MRGIAALVVVFSHCHQFFGKRSDSLTPFAETMLNDHGAVMFFFVLSGFVLAVSLARHERSVPTAITFYVRRAFRIYPALLVSAVLGALVANVFLMGQGLTLGTARALMQYEDPLGVGEFARSALALSTAANPPVWSLFVELVGSALLPIMWFTTRSRVSVAAWMGGLLLLSLFAGPFTPYSTGMFLTHFYVGATIVLWGPAFAQRVAELGAWARPTVMIGCALALYFARGVVFGDLDTRHPAPVLVEMAAAAPLIALTYYSSSGVAWLRSRVLGFLGDISYGIYLFHFPIIFMLLAAGSWALNAEAVLATPVLSEIAFTAVTVAVTVLVAAAAYYWIEKPFIHLGRGAGKGATFAYRRATRALGG
ncbi:MAG: acyltransferase [Caulobacterales bacterium]|nr:acyltransferase [Caulobacterales bacterium]